NLSGRLGYLISRNSLKQAYRRLDYAEYGGAPLVGLDGIAIVAHGGSTAIAIKNAIRQARDAAEQNMNHHIADALAELDQGGGEKEPGLTQKLWRRFRSKIESMSDKSPPASDSDERRRGGGS